MKQSIAEVMSPKKPSSVLDRPIVYFNTQSSEFCSHQILSEEPLSIRIEGKPCSIVMRTPGDEITHAEHDAGRARKDIGTLCL